MTIRNYVVCEKVECSQYGNYLACYSTRMDSEHCRYLKAQKEVPKDNLEHLLTAEQLAECRRLGL